MTQTIQTDTAGNLFVTLQCERDGCRGSATSVGPDFIQLRKNLHETGWRRRNNVRYCPQHVPKGKENEAEE